MTTNDERFTFLGRYIERTNRDKFLLARSSQIIGCFINKVASSSFVKTFLALEGLKVDKMSSPHAYRPRLTPDVRFLLLYQL